MPRTRNENGVEVPLTTSEEAQRDTEDAAYTVAKPERAKILKRKEFLKEAVVRIATQVPDWDSLDKIKTVAGMWPSLQAGANASMIAAKDIYLYAKNTAIPKLNAMNSLSTINAVDPTAADPFGDGTFWP